MPIGTLLAGVGAIACIDPLRHERLAAPPASLHRTAALAPQLRLRNRGDATALGFAAYHDFWEDAFGAADHLTPAVLARLRAMPTIRAAFQGASAADIFDGP